METGEQGSLPASVPGTAGNEHAASPAVLELGRPGFASWERVLHWSSGAAAAAMLGLVAAVILGQEPGPAGPLLVLSALALAGGLLGILVAVRSARLVRLHHAGQVTVVRLLLPPRHYPVISQVVVDEEAWGLYDGVTANAGVPHRSTSSPADGGLAVLTAVCTDGQEVVLTEVDWMQRSATADRLARFVGADVVARRSSRTASCG